MAGLVQYISGSIGVWVPPIRGFVHVSEQTASVPRTGIEGSIRWISLTRSTAAVVTRPE